MKTDLQCQILTKHYVYISNLFTSQWISMTWHHHVCIMLYLFCSILVMAKKGISSFDPTVMYRNVPTARLNVPRFTCHRADLNEHRWGPKWRLLKFWSFFPIIVIFAKNTFGVLWILFIFDRCHRSWATMTPVKYERAIQWVMDVMTIIWTSGNTTKRKELEVTSTPVVGVTKAPFANFSVSKISILQKYLLDSLNHIHIWQVSPQLSCGDTFQI